MSPRRMQSLPVEDCPHMNPVIQYHHRGEMQALVMFIVRTLLRLDEEGCRVLRPETGPWEKACLSPPFEDYGTFK